MHLLPPHRRKDVSRRACKESPDAHALASFYCEVLGLERLVPPSWANPATTWLLLPPCFMLQITQPPAPASLESPHNLDQQYELSNSPIRLRRGQHLALRVEDIAHARRVLGSHGIEYADQSPPGTTVTQVYLTTTCLSTCLSTCLRVYVCPIGAVCLIVLTTTVTQFMT